MKLETTYPEVPEPSKVWLWHLYPVWEVHINTFFLQTTQFLWKWMWIF